MRPDGAQWESAAPRRGRWLPAAVAAAALLGVVLAQAGGDGEDALPVTPEPEAPREVEPEAADEDELPPPEPEPVEIATSRGAWRDLALAPIVARADHVLVWTGVCTAFSRPPECGEALVWGGRGPDGPLVDGAAYEPVTNAWRILPEAPRGRDAAVPVAWTGSAPRTPWLGRFGGELVVWGASARDRDPDAAADEPRGAAYDPLADAWRTLPAAPIAPRLSHSLTWNGSEVVVWGGWAVGEDVQPALTADGAAYDPETDTWRLLPEAPIAPRAGHAAIATGDGSVVVVGGRGGEASGRGLVDGAVYHPGRDRWEVLAPLPPEVLPVDRLYAPTLAWLPDGPRGVVYVFAAAREPAFGAPALLAYDLDEGAWDVIDAQPLGLRTRVYAAALTGGQELLAWGGREAVFGDVLTDGARLEPAEHKWTRIPDGPAGRAGAAVSTGFQLIVWGGTGQRAVGARFDPALPSGREPTLPPLAPGTRWEVGLRQGTWHTSRRVDLPDDGPLQLRITTAPDTEVAPRLVPEGGERSAVATSVEECAVADRLATCTVGFADLPAGLEGPWHLALTVRRDGGNADVLVEVP